MAGSAGSQRLTIDGLTAPSGTGVGGQPPPFPARRASCGDTDDQPCGEHAAALDRSCGEALDDAVWKRNRAYLADGEARSGQEVAVFGGCAFLPAGDDEHVDVA